MKSKTGEDAFDFPCPHCSAELCQIDDASCFVCGYVFPDEGDKIDNTIKEFKEDYGHFTFEENSTTTH